MKRKKYHHKKKRHGRKGKINAGLRAWQKKHKARKNPKRKKSHRKGKINAGLRNWLRKHRGKKRMKNAPGDDSSKMYAGSYVRKHTKYKKHKKGRKKRSGVNARRSRPVFYVRKGAHSPIPAHTLKRSPWRKLKYALANPHKKRKKYRKHRKRTGGIIFMKNPLGMLKGVMGKAPEIAFAGAGFIGMNALMKLPVLSGIAGDWPRLGVKAILTGVLAFGAKMAFKKADISNAVLLGAGLNVVIGLVEALKLGAILPVDVVAALPAAAAAAAKEEGGGMIISREELNSIIYQ